MMKLLVVTFQNKPMADPRCQVTRCGLCRFYSHEGRRGGHCNQLNVPVSSDWKVCRLATSPFPTQVSAQVPTSVPTPAETIAQPVGIASSSAEKASHPDEKLVVDARIHPISIP